MLLAIDIGNTNIVTAVFDDTAGDAKTCNIRKKARIFTDVHRTGDEYGIIVHSILQDAGIKNSDIKNAIVSSVVPTLIGPFFSMIENLIGKKPILVNQKIYRLLPIHIPETAFSEIGADIVCNATEAFSRFDSACIIADFGTALTITAVGKAGEILGVSISPGLKTAVTALFTNAAQLPSIPLEAPPSSLGKNTIESIQSGIVLGAKGSVEYLIARMKADMLQEYGIDPKTVSVIATGGLNSVLEPITSVFQSVDKELILFGLKRIAGIVEQHNNNSNLKH